MSKHSHSDPRHGLTRRQFVGTASLAAGAVSFDASAAAPLTRPDNGGPAAAGLANYIAALDASINARRGNQSGSGSTAAVSVEAYTGATSVVQGGTLNLHARALSGNGNQQAPVTIMRVDLEDVAMLFTTMNVRRASVPSDASSAGCGWPVCLRLNVPLSWPSGLYFAYIGSGTGACTVPFVVRAARPGAASTMLVQVPVNTRQAYNNWGGKSLYDYNSTGGVRAPRVSFDRPDAERFNYAFDRWHPTTKGQRESFNSQETHMNGSRC